MLQKNKNFWVLGLVTFFVTASAWGQTDPLARFAVSTERMTEFTQKCIQMPTDADAEKDIQSWMDMGRKTTAPLLNVTLDGFPLQKITESDFLAIRTLTIPRGAHGADHDHYQFRVEPAGALSRIQRTCLVKNCGALNGPKTFDLSRFAGTTASICHDALCASRRIFGEEKGLWILWAFIKFGTNLSPLSDAMADPAGMNLQTLKAVGAAAQLVPENLRAFELQDTGFFRYQKGKSLASYRGSKVVANSFGGVFDPIDHMTFSEKVYFFVHEMAHRSRLISTPSLDESPRWNAAAAWKGQESSPEAALVSAYANVNPFEDYAESYSLYRLDPAKLKRVSPSRYEFMKNEVFDGIEYDQDLCMGSKPAAHSARL